MPKFTKKQLLIFCIILLLVDVVFIKLYVDYIKPYQLMDINLRWYRIVIIFLNLVLTFIVLLFNRKYALLFLANTIVCGLLITFFWNYYIENHPFSSAEYHFEYKNKNHILHIENNSDFYSISYAKDSIKSIHLGMHEEKGDSTLLKDWDYKKQQYINMYFYKDTLIRFPEKETKIKVTEIINE